MGASGNDELREAGGSTATMLPAGHERVENPYSADVAAQVADVYRAVGEFQRATIADIERLRTTLAEIVRQAQGAVTRLEGDVAEADAATRTMIDVSERRSWTSAALLTIGLFFWAAANISGSGWDVPIL